MSRSVRATISLVLALLNALAVSTGTARADVLCFGSDGHVAVENPGARAKCHAEQASALAGPHTAEITQGHSCVDVPIVTDAQASEARASVDLKPTLKVIPLALADVVLTGVAKAELVAGIPRGASPPELALPLASLRTIVLLV
jgi:hypothetical protein